MVNYRRPVRITRDTVLLVCGLAGIAYETLAVEHPDPSLLLLFGGMIGLPAVLHQDDRAKRNDEDRDREELR